MDTDSKPISSSILVEGELTEKILGAAFRAQNTLGVGFLEKVYENALNIELRKYGLSVESQKAFPVRYEGTVVGDYQADLVVAGKVIVECKAVTALDQMHEAQLLNYLKASGLHIGLLINFGRSKLQYRRLVL
jgi:GxxExxY protein